MNRLLVSISGILFALGFACLTQAQVPMTGAGLGKPAVAASSTCATLISQVSNIIGCWDADLGVATAGANVTSWTDQSSNGYVLGLNAAGGQTAPASPQFSSSSYNSKAGISFTVASRQYLATTAAAIAFNSTTSSWFVAAQFGSTTQGFGRMLSFWQSTGQTFGDFADNNSVGPLMRDSTNQNVTWYQNNVQGPTAAITYDTPTRMGVVFDNTNGTIYLNNSQAAQASKSFTVGVAAGSQLAVGEASALAAVDALINGVIRRIVITSSAVSSGDRGNIDTFLQN